MPFDMAIKWLHRGLTSALLVLVIGFLWLNYQPNTRGDDELQRTYPLSDSQWLFVTVSRDGGATVPVTYRYYLSGPLRGSDADIIRQLSEQVPLITGTGSITDAKIDDNGNINIAYSGKIFALNGSFDSVRLTIKK